MPPPPRPPVGAAPMSASKLHKKERILQAINRMNDRDTQKSAADDLLNIVKHMDMEGLPITISCLCSTGPEFKVYARKECARALGAIASPLCPLRDTALQQPHLGKVLGQLRKCLQDADSSVREASTDALTLVAQGLMQLQAAGVAMPPPPPQPAGGPGAAGPAAAASNPVLRLLFECLTEQKKELNAAACATLGVAAPYLGTLEPPLAKELVRKLNSPAFQAAPALLAALARTDPVSGEPSGLIKSGPGAFVPIMSALVGQLPQPGGGTPGAASGGGGGSGSGVVGCLYRQADWQTRQAAADMLRATALLLGPLMEVEGVWAPGDLRGITTRALRALESCKFDKVREVRDVARAALAVLEDLQAYGAGGGSAAGWPPHIAEKLRARGAPVPTVPDAETAPAVAAAAAPPLPVPGRKSPLRRSSPSPGRRRPVSANVRASPPRLSPERQSSPVFQRAGSLSERFRAAHQDNMGDMVRDPLRREYSAGWEAPPQPVEADAAKAAAGEGGSRALSRQGSKAGSVSSRAPGPVEPQVSIRSRDGGGPEDLNATMRGLAGLGFGDVGQQQQEEEDVLMASGGPPTFARQLSGNSSRTPPRRDIDGGQPPLPAWVTAADTLPSAAPAYQPSPAVFGGGGAGGAGPAGAGAGDSPVDPVAAMPHPLIPGAVPSAATPPSPVPGWPPSLPPPGALLPAPASLGLQAAPGSPLPPASALGPTVTVPSEEWLAQQARLRELEGQTRALLAAFNAMSEQSGRAITGLQARVRILEAALEAAQSQLTSGTAAAGAYALPPPMALPPPPSPPPHLVGSASAASLAGLPPPLPPLLTVQDSDVWLAGGAGGRGGALRASSPMHASGGLGGSVAAGRLAAYAYESGGVVSPRVSLQLPSSVQASQDLTPGSLATAGSGSGLATPTAAGAGGSGGGGGGGDLRTAYREVLAGAGGGRPGDMQLLRLLQRSGPVWNELGHELSCQLLACFIGNLQAGRPDGPMLSRILPWLWRLADDDNTRFEAPLPLRAQLLAALRTAHGAVSDPQLYEKMALLQSTLQTHWSQPDSPTAAARAAAGAAAAAQAQAPAAPEGYAAAYAASAAAAAAVPGSGGGGGSGGGAGLDDAGHSTVSITPAYEVQASPPPPQAQAPLHPPALQAEPSAARSVAGSVAGSLAGERAAVDPRASVAGSVASAAGGGGSRQVPPLPTAAALQSPPPLGSLPASARSSVAGSVRASAAAGSARGSAGDVAGATPPATPPAPGGSGGGGGGSPAPGSVRASVAGSVRGSVSGSLAGGGGDTPGGEGRPGSRGGLLGAVPSINTLQNDFAALQRDFAAMSPAKSRTPPPPM